MRMMTIITIVLAIMILSAPAWADNTDPNGTQLQSIVKNYLDTAPPGDKDANTLKKALGNTDGIHIDWEGLIREYGAGIAACSIEIATGVGAIIWETRRNLDPCKSKNHLGDLANYCVQYTANCNHWNWDKGCLSKRISPWCE